MAGENIGTFDEDDTPRLATAHSELTSTSSEEWGTEQIESVLGFGRTPMDARPVSTPIKWEDERPGNSPLENVQGSELSALRWISWWKKLVLCLGALLFLFSTLLAITQTAAFVRSVDVLPFAIRAVAYAAISLLWAAMLVIIGSTFVLFFRLRPSPRISISALALLSKRRNGSRRDLEGAREATREFLKSYPRTKEQQRLLVLAGIDGSTTGINVEGLFGRIEHVLANDLGGTTQWVKSVQRTVIETLDVAADKLIRRSAIQVGVKTAISPRGVIDSLIVIAHSWLLIGNLCRIYNLRPSVWEVLIILGFTGFNAIISDRGDAVASSLQDEIVENGASYVSGITANLLGMVASRAAEGSVNALLIHRLGQQAKSYLRPIQP